MHDDFRHILHCASLNIVEYQEVIRVIEAHYQFSPIAYRTGIGTAFHTVNPAGKNPGSLKVLAYARRLRLAPAATLPLWGEHFRAVQSNPEGTDHPNIRAFMAGGWDGVHYDEEPLTLRGPG